MTSTLEWWYRNQKKCIRHFFQALVYRKDKEKLKELIDNSVEYQNLSEDTFEMIVKFLGMAELWKIKDNFKSHNDERRGC